MRKTKTTDAKSLQETIERSERQSITRDGVRRASEDIRGKTKSYELKSCDDQCMWGRENPKICEVLGGQTELPVGTIIVEGSEGTALLSTGMVE